VDAQPLEDVLGMIGLNRLTAADQSGLGPHVDVSIVVTSWNEEKYLPVLLESLRTQATELRHEVIVVDDTSTDASVAVATAAGAQVLHSGDQGDVPKMRNQGLARARGIAVLFADADVAFSHDYLEQMAVPIVAGRADVTLCLRHAVLESRFPVLPDARSKSYVWFLRHLPWWWFMKMPVRLFPWISGWIGRVLRQRKACSPLTVPDRVGTPAIMVRTELACEIGGWRGAFGTHEDTQF
jgi:glycosyltransferase involved in cell wall biosynthesis